MWATYIPLSPSHSHILLLLPPFQEMLAADEQQLGRMAAINRAYAQDGDESSPSKRIGPTLALALTLAAFILFSLLARAPPHTQTMRILNGGEQDREQVVLLGRRRDELGMNIRSRRLSGLGSHPPSCKSKCGRCVPCKAVRVPIHPGRNRPLEYYPEAWRCKCGNKLYMP